MAAVAQGSIDRDIAQYRGLVYKTASMYVGIVEEDFDDIVQFLTVKVWRAIVAFDPSRSQQPRDRYVFSCLRNGVKDLVKRPRRNLSSIDGMTDGSTTARDHFELRHNLVASHEQVFGHVEDDDLVLPSTLTCREREIVALLYAEFMQIEIAARLGLSKGEMEKSVRSIRAKLADWCPGQDMPARRRPAVLAA